MIPFNRCLAGLAAVSAVVVLGACGTPAEADKRMASTRSEDCPIGTYICRRERTTSPTETTSAEALRNQGITTMGGMGPGQMMNRGGGS